jgi:predicted RNA-binding Zn-ribbon protein involved in translation (DUF1610 family)
LKRSAERQKSGERVRKIADQTIAVLKKPEQYLDYPCAACGLTKLIQLGTKVRCQNCGFFGDRFQDGDNAD